MSLDILPSTEEGNNWTVAVFRCPRKNWTETLRDLYSELDKQKLSLTPHYTIRKYERQSDSFIISFRILRRQKHEEAIKSLIEKFMNGYAYEIGDPKAETSFPDCHQWIRHGAKDAKWNKEKCEVLSKLSRLALEIIHSDTIMEERYEWLHLFANMTAIFQIEERVWTAETYPREWLMRH